MSTTQTTEQIDWGEFGRKIWNGFLQFLKALRIAFLYNKNVSFLLECRFRVIIFITNLFMLLILINSFEWFVQWMIGNKSFLVGWYLFSCLYLALPWFFKTKFKELTDEDYSVTYMTIYFRIVYLLISLAGLYLFLLVFNWFENPLPPPIYSFWLLITWIWVFKVKKNEVDYPLFILDLRPINKAFKFEFGLSEGFSKLIIAAVVVILILVFLITITMNNPMLKW